MDEQLSQPKQISWRPDSHWAANAPASSNLPKPSHHCPWCVQDLQTNPPLHPKRRSRQPDGLFSAHAPATMQQRDRPPAATSTIEDRARGLPPSNRQAPSTTMKRAQPTACLGLHPINDRQQCTSDQQQAPILHPTFQQPYLALIQRASTIIWPSTSICQPPTTTNRPASDYHSPLTNHPSTTYPRLQVAMRKALLPCLPIWNLREPRVRPLPTMKQASRPRAWVRIQATVKHLPQS